MSRKESSGQASHHLGINPKTNTEYAEDCINMESKQSSGFSNNLFEL